MNREIKFRGMDIDGRWFYGNLAILTENVRHLKQGHYISNSIGLPFAYQVRPETVGQFTGLKDKNGKEVYEGDIVQDSISTGKVVYSDKRGGYRVTYTDGMAKWFIDYSDNEFKVVEVIGNIYEHQELLEG